MGAVKKEEVVRRIAAQTGLPREDVSLVLRDFFEVVRGSLSEGDEVHFRGFGTFKAKKRAAKVARDIGRNTAVFVEARRVPFFKPAASFSRQVRESVS